MPIFAIPTSDAPFYTQKTSLDGTEYGLSFAYNQREDRWYLSIADDEEVPVVSGIKIIANTPLLFRHRYNVAMPAGEMMALDTTTDGTPPGRGELGKGKRVRLVYFDAAWVAAFVAAQPTVVKPVAIEVFLSFSLRAGISYVGDEAFATAVLHAFKGSPVSFSTLILPPGLDATVIGFDLQILAPPPPDPATLSPAVLVASPNQTFVLSSVGNIHVVAT